MSRLMVAAILLLAAGTARADNWSQVDHRWGIGLRTASQNLQTEALEDNELHLAGGGLHVRWRFADHWSAELSLEGLHADEHDGAYVRDMNPSTITFAYHFTPYRRWDWKILMGVGGTEDEVTYRTVDGRSVTETAHEVHVHFGFGVERRFGHFGVGAELRAVGIARDDEEDDVEIDPATDFRAIPGEQSGGQLNLHVTYYF